MSGSGPTTTWDPTRGSPLNRRSRPGLRAARPPSHAKDRSSRDLLRMRNGVGIACRAVGQDDELRIAIVNDVDAGVPARGQRVNHDSADKRG